MCCEAMLLFDVRMRIVFAVSCDFSLLLRVCSCVCMPLHYVCVGLVCVCVCVGGSFHVGGVACEMCLRCCDCDLCVLCVTGLCCCFAGCITLLIIVRCLCVPGARWCWCVYVFNVSRFHVCRMFDVVLLHVLDCVSLCDVMRVAVPVACACILHYVPGPFDCCCCAMFVCV